MDTKITVVTDVDLDSLIDDMIFQLCYEHLAEFVIDLDLMVADWDFTEMLYQHFKAQHKIFKEEKKLDKFVGMA